MKFLEYIAPNWVAKRYAKKVKMELMRHKYDTIKHMNYSEHGASTRKNAFKGFDDSLHTADEDIGDNKEILMARSRQLYMGNSIALGAIRKLRTNIVGTGLKLKSKINKKILGLNDKEAQEIQENIQNLWELWANSTEPDMTGQSNFYQLQSLAMLTQLVDGECFVALEYPEDNKDFFELKIKLIDSSRCVEPFGSDSKAKNGVELDKNGKPIAYWFVKSTDDTEPVRIEAFSKTGRKNILVLMEKERIGQRRGVPLLSPVIEILHQITKFTNAELMNAVISSLFTVFITSDRDSNPISDMFQEQQQSGDKTYELGNGTIMELEPGQKVEFANPNRPNTNFDNFVFSMCKQIGTALEIPVEVLLSNFNASYSASKASLEEVWKTYKMRRIWFVNNFCQPIFEEWLDEAVAKGYIKLKGYDNPLKRKCYQGTEWYGEVQAQLDPLKEIRAAEKRIELGISTVARESLEINGSDWRANLEQRKIEQKIIGDGSNDIQ